MILRNFALLLASLMLLANSPSDRAQELVDAGDQKAAFEVISEAVAGGSADDAEALAYLGWFYEEGIGTEIDKAKAAAAYRQSAALGNNYSRWSLGVMIDMGQTEGTAEEAVALFQQAADEGHADGMLSLAVMQAAGRGTAQDFGAAMANYRKGAERGNPHGVRGVGLMYERGESVEANAREAAAWYLVSAAMGHASGEASFQRILPRLEWPADQAIIVGRAKVVAASLGVEIDTAYFDSLPSEVKKVRSLKN